jgi:hypothetical protein
MCALLLQTYGGYLIRRVDAVGCSSPFEGVVTLGVRGL